MPASSVSHLDSGSILLLLSLNIAIDDGPETFSRGFWPGNILTVHRRRRRESCHLRSVPMDPATLLPRTFRWSISLFISSLDLKPPVSLPFSRHRALSTTKRSCLPLGTRCSARSSCSSTLISC